MRAGQAQQQRVQSVADALGVGPAVGRGHAERGADDLVAVAEQFPGVHRARQGDGGLQELPYDVEGHGGDGLATARRPHRAPARGQPPDLGQQGRLADAGLAAAHEDSTGRHVGAERFDSACGGGEFRLALQQRDGDRVLRAGHHHPSPNHGGPRA
ncbi:hypothetical protein GCM10009730_14300 [Streptomyces albidochromogenes]